jgi:hypothetical protein
VDSFSIRGIASHPTWLSPPDGLDSGGEIQRARLRVGVGIGSRRQARPVSHIQDAEIV